MEWIVRNISFLAFFLILASVVAIVLPLVGEFRNLGHVDSSLLVGGIISVAISLTGIAIAYGLLLRFLTLCDDVAAIRKARTGTPSSFD